MILFVTKNAAVRPCGLMLIGSWSQVNKFPCAQYPLTITYNSIVVHPPYKKTRFAYKKTFRFTSLSKTFSTYGVFFLLTAWVFESECNERFFVRDEIPFFCKQPAVSLWLSAESELDIRRLEACLQAANGRFRSSTQVSRSVRRLRVFGYNKYQRSHGKDS